MSNGEAVGPCMPSLSLGPPFTNAFSINPSPSPLSYLSPKTHSLPLSGPFQTSKKPCCSSSLRRASEGLSRSSAKTKVVVVDATLPLSPLLSQYSSPYSRTQSLFFFLTEPIGRRTLKLTGAVACPWSRGWPTQWTSVCMQAFFSWIQCPKSPPLIFIIAPR
jgi:hypothetical protein